MSKYTYRYRVGGIVWRSNSHFWASPRWIRVNHPDWFARSRFIDVPDTYVRLLGGTIE